MEQRKKAVPPWGTWEVLLEEAGYKVKRISVNPGARMSYQRHERRREHWLIVEGTAKVTLDGRETMLKRGESIDVPMGTAHRIGNISGSAMTFIEIQIGDYFGEDDIVRLEDDYGRETKGESGKRKR